MNSAQCPSYVPGKGPALALATHQSSYQVYYHLPGNIQNPLGHNKAHCDDDIAGRQKRHRHHEQPKQHRRLSVLAMLQREINI